MDLLTLAIPLLALFGLVAAIAGVESRDGFDDSERGRTTGR